MNKKLVFPVVALAILGVMVLGDNKTSAKTREINQDAYIQSIATKFDLEEEEVEQIFEEIRSEYKKEKDREKNMTKLKSEVSDLHRSLLSM